MDNRTLVRSIRLTPAEFAAAKAMAKKRGMTLSELVRHLLAEAAR